MTELFEQLLYQVEQLGWVAPALYVVLYILLTIFLVPATPMTIAAGVLFGLVRGSILATLGATLGATAAFLAGRTFARDWAARKLQHRPALAAMDDAVGREGWKIVSLSRLSPIFPFTLINYAYGLTQVRLRHYVTASLIGMIPPTVMYVYIGSLARLGVDTTDAGPTLKVFRIIGLFATIAVTLLIMRLARKALRERVQQKT